jgi:hypothetical protein
VDLSSDSSDSDAACSDWSPNSDLSPFSGDDEVGDGECVEELELSKMEIEAGAAEEGVSID